MFLDFYQLREQPFGVTPDPRYLYFSPSHREALASLFYGIETSRGFLSLIAEPGLGKTTLLFQLLQRWKGYVHSAFLFQTQCDSRELIRYLLRDLGLNDESEDIVHMHSELNEFLFRESLAGRRVVVFIDEAQNLADDVLETVRLLSDFEATDKKLMQIVLAGQPELSQRLARPGLSQLRQRIAVQARLEPLAAGDVLPYISHRLEVAGYSGPELFTPGALALLAERSRGIPRLINHLCFSALSIGCALEKKQINSEVVHEAARDLSLETPHPTPAASHQAPPAAATTRGASIIRALKEQLGQALGNRRALEVSAVVVILVFAAIFFTRRPQAKAVRSDAAMGMESSRATPPAQHADPPPTRSADPKPADPPVVQKPAVDPPAKHAAYFVYAVQPKDTLHDICMSGLGSYDPTVLAEVRKLNPELRNPNQLEVGQQIRLPLDISSNGKPASKTN
ncbi:MAG TPA: AAA family ATPase [Candidatus Acidoferrum sp.]|nr:AAA family ATPase [Candidatus Acidoferrum sp.]